MKKHLVYFAAFIFTTLVFFSLKEQLRHLVAHHASASLRLENFQKVETLQEELKKLFPKGTPVEAVDEVLVGQNHAYRTDNLLKSYIDNSTFTFGSSSDDNYVFYYKPLKPDGKQGWENTTSGWAVKLEYGGSGSLTVIDGKLGPDGKNRGLRKITVLAAPGDNTNGGVALLKELLQYKIDFWPVDNLIKPDWDALVQEHQLSSCKADISYRCLIKQATSLLGLTDGTATSANLAFLGDVVLEHGDQQTAKALLKIWPSEGQLRKEVESVSRLMRFTPERMDNEAQVFHAKYVQLLFLTGDYALAETMLTELHERYKTGNDYGAIYTLVNAGALDEAYKVSALTYRWKREVPDPNENSSAIMHCQVYPHTKPEEMGALAMHFIKAGNTNKAYDVAQFIREYWENDGYGQKSHCYTSAAEHAYFSSMNKLIEIKYKAGDKSDALKLFQELLSVSQTEIPEVKSYNRAAFKQLAKTADTYGFTDEAKKISAFIDLNHEPRYNKYSDRYNPDPIPLSYALNGDYPKAIEVIENMTLISPEKGSLEQEFKIPQTPLNEMKLNSYMTTAKALAAKNDKKGTLLMLEKATQYMGTRNPDYNIVTENLQDNIDAANILMDIGEKEKSRVVLDGVLDTFSKTDAREFPVGEINKSFLGQLAYLYAQHENITVVQAWADMLPFYYAGFYYSKIGALLINEKRWDELDLYLPKVAEVMSTDDQPISNYQTLIISLIKSGQYSRYLQLLDMIKPGDDASLEKQGKYYRGLTIKRTTKAPDQPQKIWLAQQLVLAALNGTAVPADVLEKAWPLYINNCQSAEYILPHYSHGKKFTLTAKETMAACYLGLINQLRKDTEETGQN